MPNPDIEILDRDGFVVLDGILPPELVEQARRDFEKLFEADVRAREERGITSPHFEGGPAGYTVRTKPSHLAIDIMGKSKVFDDLVERMLNHPRVCEVVKAWSGPHFRIGSVNLRYMTGEYDPAPAHELHRDGPYAMNLCIFLSDIPPGDNGATAMVKGSHRTTVNPRFDCLFERPFRLKKNHAKPGLDFFMTWNIFNRLLKARHWRNYTGAFGKQGDVYFMANGEVWHGRVPNLHGRKGMICLMGCAATTPEYAAVPQTVPAEVTANLPPRFRQGVGGPYTINDPTGSMIDRLWKERKPAPNFSLERWAMMERNFAEWVSDLWIIDFLRNLGYRFTSLRMRARSFLGRGYRFISRMLRLQ